MFPQIKGKKIFTLLLKSVVIVLKKKIEIDFSIYMWINDTIVSSTEKE